MASTHAHDDGFHEIQLSGKQLVFLFMAATVVSVVIFICGVMVGRGVRIERGAVAQAAALSEAPAPDALAAAPASNISSAAGDPTTAAPPQPVDDLGYFDRLGDTNSSGEELTPAVQRTPPRDKAADKPADKPAEKIAASSSAPAVAAPKATAALKETASRPAPAPAAAPAPAPAKTPQLTSAATTASVTQPAATDDGFAVQVAAVNGRADADAIAKKLSGKGYPAYVQAPAGGAGSVYRVRVGSYKTRREAETIAAKLQKEEQIKPWVTR